VTRFPSRIARRLKRTSQYIVYEYRNSGIVKRQLVIVTYECRVYVAIAIYRTEYHPKVDVEFVSHIYNQTEYPVESDHHPSSRLVLYDLFIVSPADSRGSYSLTDRQRGSAVAIGQVDLPRRGLGSMSTTGHRRRSPAIGRSRASSASATRRRRPPPVPPRRLVRHARWYPPG
jgi:hypothetical protein